MSDQQDPRPTPPPPDTTGGSVRMKRKLVWPDASYISYMHTPLKFIAWRWKEKTLREKIEGFLLHFPIFWERLCGAWWDEVDETEVSA